MKMPEHVKGEEFSQVNSNRTQGYADADPRRFSRWEHLRRKIMNV